MDDDDPGRLARLSHRTRLTPRISRELNGDGLPDLSWYDLLWALYRPPRTGPCG